MQGALRLMVPHVESSILNGDDLETPRNAKDGRIGDQLRVIVSKLVFLSSEMRVGERIGRMGRSHQGTGWWRRLAEESENPEARDKFCKSE
jgi:hypothetical protein